MSNETGRLLSSKENAERLMESIGQLKQGDKISIATLERSARGHLVMNGRSIKTGRKMKGVEPAVFVVK